MSKNYSKNVQPVEATVETEVAVEETVETEVEEKKVAPEPKPVYGVVNCEKLNIRKEANKADNVLRVVDEGSELKIDMTKSTPAWYKVCTAEGVEGFCMKKFVTVR